MNNFLFSASKLLSGCIIKYSNTHNVNSIKNGEIFIQDVMKKVKQDALIRTTVFSVIIGACAFFLFPQIQPIASSFNSLFSSLFTNLPLHYSGEYLKSLQLPFIVLVVSFISFLLLDLSAD